MSSHAACLYMLWPRMRQALPDPVVTDGYALRTHQSGEEPAVIDLLGRDGEAIGEQEWNHYRNTLLPNGLFVVEQESTGALVGTAGAVHNPNPGRYYFPFGGELGYLILAEAHRKRGLGSALCRAVLRRLLAAGYESIRVCVQEHRAAAIRTYMALGFEPFLHTAEVEQRWRRACSQIGAPFTPEQWPKTL